MIFHDLQGQVVLPGLPVLNEQLSAICMHYQSNFSMGAFYGVKAIISIFIVSFLL
jgi:hypothetical protein